VAIASNGEAAHARGHAPVTGGPATGIPRRRGKAMKMKLTKRSVEAITPAARDVLVWDPEEKAALGR
jgi:hypothetical protein